MASNATASSSDPAAPVARLDRHPSLAPLLISLNGYYTAKDIDAPGQPSQMYSDLRVAWWPLARAKYVSNPSVECRVWADFFVANIRADALDVLCHAIFGSALAAIRGQAELRQRFERVTSLLGKSSFEAFVWLGDEVSRKSNSLKNLSSLLAPTGRHALRPAALLAELNAEMLRRHADNPASPPVLASIDVTNVFRRYNPRPPSRMSSATPSNNAFPPAPALAPVASTKRPVAEVQAEAEVNSRPSSAKRARLHEDDEDDDEDTIEIGRGDESDLASFRELSSGFGPSPFPPGCSGLGDDVGAGDLKRGCEARMALLRPVIEFETPTAEQVGGQTAGFWGVFRGFAEQLMKAEDNNYEDTVSPFYIYKLN
ncbi:hypothetical protein HD806DRAFT_550143 [Xylariaceae sp. AK1471]|nr:hypothetical protein HD806DRAFT_550143 [Xylariaceae sp. AK1471]